jgi:hypothetical protein
VLPFFVTSSPQPVLSAAELPRVRPASPFSPPSVRQPLRPDFRVSIFEFRFAPVTDHATRITPLQQYVGHFTRNPFVCHSYRKQVGWGHLLATKLLQARFSGRMETHVLLSSMFPDLGARVTVLSVRAHLRLQPQSPHAFASRFAVYPPRCAPSTPKSRTAAHITLPPSPAFSIFRDIFHHPGVGHSPIQPNSFHLSPQALIHSLCPGYSLLPVHYSLPACYPFIPVLIKHFPTQLRFQGAPCSLCA